jgi:hypothetical protein
MVIMKRVSLIFCFSLIASWAHGETSERMVWGKVTHVEPITQAPTHTSPKGCPAEKPAAGASLTNLLSWDLDPKCHSASASRIVGYRVDYHWDGRKYSINMTEHPGDRIPLRMTLR